VKQRMIISRTPLRITFVGGGTDIREFYTRDSPGAVLSASINKYIYITVNKKFDSQIRISYSTTEIVDKVDMIRHPTVREALKFLDIDGGIEIVSISDIPSLGTGMGSSSTFLVGLLHALHAYRGEYVSSREMAEEAVKIEREILHEPGGKQDQYMAAYGGIQLMKFYQDETVSIKPLVTSEEIRETLENNLLLLYTGIQRSSADIHRKQSSSVQSKLDEYRKMREIALQLFDDLSRGNADRMGTMLHENWKLKKRLAEGISSDSIDQLYERAMRLGATGGKLIGAGGGGFLLFYAPHEVHDNIVNGLGLKKQDFRFDYQGSRIIFVGE
jgi:D-glycero-alpha-D-manno-heptose-7-phosphate kinase